MKDDLARESAERRSKKEEGISQILDILNEFDGSLPEDVRKLAADAEKIFKSHPVASLATAFLAGLVIGRIAGRKS